MQVSSEQYKFLCDVLGRVCNLSSDVIIKNGKIIQVSDDKAILFAIDLSKIIGDLSVNIGMLEQKLKLMRIVSLSGDDINIDTTQDGNTKCLILSDSNTKVAIIQPDAALLTTDALDDSAIESIKNTFTDIVTFDLDAIGIKKLLTAASCLNLKAFNIIAKENGIYALSTTSQGGDQGVTIMEVQGRQVEFIRPGDKVYCNVPLVIFDSVPAKISLKNAESKFELLVGYEPTIEDISASAYQKVSVV
ncbi:MAG: hypothetical protein GXO10_04910 [Crenarchaeota archaeon]|nr:hypothetical protein [Thermoproteota archaeon]